MKKMFATTSVIVMGLLLAGCSGTSGLSSSIERAIDQSDTTLELSSLVSGDVTGFLVVCPYESRDSVADRLGFDWPDGPDYAAVEDRQTIAFIEDDTITSQAELSRHEIDFCGSGKWEVLPVDTTLAVARSGGSTRISTAE